MNKRMGRFGLIAVLALTLAACVPTWQLSGGEDLELGRYSLKIPNGWLFLKSQGGAELTASTDGPLLQTISSSFQTYDKAFKSSKASVDANTLAFELMEYYIAEYKANNSALAIDVVNREAVTLGGRDGFRTEMVFKNNEGLRFHIAAIGCSDGEGVYVLSYQAPDLYYYQKNLEDFQRVADSFKIK